MVYLIFAKANTSVVGIYKASNARWKVFKRGTIGKRVNWGITAGKKIVKEKIVKEKVVREKIAKKSYNKYGRSLFTKVCNCRAKWLQSFFK